MDIILLIILILIVILIIYIIMQYISTLTSGTSTADASYNGTIDLNDTIIDEITASELTNPTSLKYSFGVWIYINSWNTNNEKLLITKTSFSNNIGDSTLASVDTNYDICLFLDQIQSNLMCSFNSTQSGVPISPILIVPGFPLQKWTFVVVSVNNQIFDSYIDGKLVISKKLEALPKITNSGIIFGDGQPNDIMLKNFEWWASAMDPTTVWNNYVENAGAAVAAQAQYQANLTISSTTNGNAASNYRLF